MPNETMHENRDNFSVCCHQKTKMSDCSDNLTQKTETENLLGKGYFFCAGGC